MPVAHVATVVPADGGFRAVRSSSREDLGPSAARQGPDRINPPGPHATSGPEVPRSLANRASVARPSTAPQPRKGHDRPGRCGPRECPSQRSQIQAARGQLLEPSPGVPPGPGRLHHADSSSHRVLRAPVEGHVSRSTQSSLWWCQRSWDPAWRRELRRLPRSSGGCPERVRPLPRSSWRGAVRRGSWRAPPGSGRLPLCGASARTSRSRRVRRWRLGAVGAAEQPPLPQARRNAQDVVGPDGPLEELRHALLGDGWKSSREDPRCPRGSAAAVRAAVSPRAQPVLHRTFAGATANHHAAAVVCGTQRRTTPGYGPTSSAEVCAACRIPVGEEGP